MKRILVPTDFSDCAQAAADVAIAIAVKTNAEIYFLHLHAPEPTGGHMAMHGGGSHEGHPHHDCSGPARARLDQLVKAAEQQGISAKSALVLDEDWEQVEKHAEAFSIDLIIMGSHGINKIRRIFLGSHALQMIRHTDLPVLIIKASVTDFKIRRVVFVTTLEEREQEALAFLDQVTCPWSAVIHLVYVSKPMTSEETDVSLGKIQQLTKGLKTPVEFSICNEEGEIKKVAVNLDADLVVLTTHGKNSLVRAVSSGLAEKFAGEYQRPVLVINTK
ncbi:MAG: universal stress protein [Cyclobacteriaceae bacterium]|nr:universal stress protein [Cyclobacteriaceae bacterium]